MNFVSNELIVSFMEPVVSLSWVLNIVGLVLNSVIF